MITFEKWWADLNKKCHVIMIEEEMAKLAWEARVPDGYSVVRNKDIALAYETGFFVYDLTEIAENENINVLFNEGGE